MTIDEALQELSAIVEQHTSPDGFYTTDELCEASGRSRFYIGTKLKQAHKAGRLEVRNVPRPTITGKMWPKPGYRILPNPS